MTGPLPHTFGIVSRLVTVISLVSVVALHGQVPAVPDLIPFAKKGPSGGIVWGYADTSGRLVIPAQFESARRFDREGLAEIRKNGRWGMIDRQGKEVIAPRLTSQSVFSDGLAVACVDTGETIPGLTILGPKPGERTPVTRSKCGFLNRAGKVVVPIQFDGVRPFREGVAAVTNSRTSELCPAVDMGRATLYGIIDVQGKVVVPIEHCHVGPAEDGWIRVVYESRGPNQDRVGFVDREGRTLLAKLPYDFAGERWREGLLPVRTGNRWGFIDRQGREVIPLRYDEVSVVSEGLVRSRLDGKWGFVDATGKVAVPFTYDDAGDFDSGLACVKVGDRSGFIDRTGKLAIPPRFDWNWTCHWRFSEGLRPTLLDGKWGFIDRDGQFAIRPQFDEARGFSEGLAAVKRGDLWGFIDRAGATVVPFRYFRIDQGFIEGLAYVTTRVVAPCCPGIFNFAEGFIDRQGREFFDAP